MAVDGGVPRGRLSLLLFDSAAETLLRATAATQMLRAEMAARYSAVDPAGSSGPGDEWKKAGTLSARQRKQIEREFNALVDYVFAQENWPLSGEYADGLKVLHRFRNAAYHRDDVRPDVLGPALAIYAYLVAHLLHHRLDMLDEFMTPPDEVREFLAGDELGEGKLGPDGHSSSDLEAAMGVACSATSNWTTVVSQRSWVLTSLADSMTSIATWAR